MRLNYKFIILFIGLILQGFLGISQESIEKSMLSKNLQNVEVSIDQDEINIAYENNYYRNQVEALAQVLVVIKEEIKSNPLFLNKESLPINILILHKGVDLVAVHTNSQNFSDLITNKISDDQFIKNLNLDFNLESIRKKLDFSKRKNSSFLKTDLITGATIDYILGNFDNPVRLKFNLQPELSTVLYKGITFSTMFNIPIGKNDYDYNNQSNIIISRFSKDYRLIEGFYGHSGLGFFTFNRFGSENSFFYFPLKTDQFRLNAGFTLTSNGYWDYNYNPTIELNNFYSTYYLGGTYRWRKHNFDIDLRYGKYLISDHSINLSVTKQYDEKFVGFFLRKSENGTLIGFDIQVNIGFRHHLKPGYFRPRTREFFYIPYYYLPKPAGLSFYGGENLLLNMKEFYPSNFKMELEKYLLEIN